MEAENILFLFILLLAPIAQNFLGFIVVQIGRQGGCDVPSWKEKLYGSLFSWTYLGQNVRYTH